jgi:hypothetical protein
MPSLQARGVLLFLMLLYWIIFHITDKERETKYKLIWKESYIQQEETHIRTLASKVLPVPGSPYNMTPLGGLIPMSSYSSGCVRGSSTASLISCIWASKPPMSAYDSSGAFSTFITDTIGSTSS